MAYRANQYNYATPLSSSTNLVGNELAVADIKYFTLSDNVLDGSYTPIAGDVGIWGSAAADSDGVLSEPFVLTVEEDTQLNAFRLVGSDYVYPVDFTVEFFDGDNLLYSINESGNSNVEYVHYMPATLHATRYVITISKVSSPGAVVRLYNVYNPDHVKRIDNTTVSIIETSSVCELISVKSVDTFSIYVAANDVLSDNAVLITAYDSLKLKETSSDVLYVHAKSTDSVRLKCSEASATHNIIDRTFDTAYTKTSASSHILNTIGQATDMAALNVKEDISDVIVTFDPTFDSLKVKSIENMLLTNVHSIMKAPSRQVYGKVYITYTDPILDTVIDIKNSPVAYNSNIDHILDDVNQVEELYFTLYDNDLSGRYKLRDEYSQTGFVSSVISGADGYFSEPPFVRFEFSVRPVIDLTIYFDASHGCVAENFTVSFIDENGVADIKEFTGNTSGAVNVGSSADAVAIEIRVSKVTKPGYPVAIVGVPFASTLEYVGYQDRSDLISIDMLEELTYEDDIEALGGLSANEVTVTLDNSSRVFNFNNVNSIVGRRLHRNRKIVPWLGVEIVPGEIEWYTLGTYWSYSWNVPVEGLTASVVGFDTLGLLDTTSFIDHDTLVDKSLGYLIDYVMEDAKKIFTFLEWKVADELYDVIIPYAWFAAESHTAALRKICSSYPMHVYCDRDGRVCAAPQKLKLDYYYDTWSDSTNVMGKEYSSLHTALPNIINVTVNNILESTQELVRDTLTFNVASVPTRQLVFGKPYLSDLVVDIVKDATVGYSYTVHSWGIEFSFSGTGYVHAITCSGKALDTSNTALYTVQDRASVQLNGAITRNIAADFIQTSELAAYIAGRLQSLSEEDKYDVEVNYRGDIALTINDPIRLLDGIAPDNRYNIKRHQLFWNGSLSGSADLNT